MKLTRGATLTPTSRVRTIFLPSSSHIQINPSQSVAEATTTEPLTNVDDINERNENFLRKIDASKTNENFILNKIRQINLNEVSKRNKGKFRFEDDNRIIRNTTTKPPSILTKKNRRRNDKFLHRRPTNPEDYELFSSMNVRDRERPTGTNYYDCMTAGWGKFSTSGDLSDVLLKIDVPIHNIKRLIMRNFFWF